MNYLIILSLVSISGAIFMLIQKISKVAVHLETSEHESHTNFIVVFLKLLVNQIKQFFVAYYLKIRPHAHDLISFLASRLYRLSAWFALEFLKFYNFIQGRKIIKNSGSASLFIRDITRDKEEGRIARKGV